MNSDNKSSLPVDIDAVGQDMPKPQQTLDQPQGPPTPFFQPASFSPEETTPGPQHTLEQPDGPPIPLSVIPGYRLKLEIAQGGMGIIYGADCITFGREVAIKVMKSGKSKEMFNREAKITARLPHPAIPPVHSLGTLPNGLPYLVMKLIRGETLDKILNNRADITIDRGKLIAVYEQICQAVGYAHSQGIIHRDLKPSNVMVGAFGEVQVMDWGLAKELRAIEENATDDLADDENLTVAGDVKGTPAYMAPEQARGEEVDARADVFALGGILAAVLTGQPPFSGDSVMQTIQRAAKCDLNDTLGRLDNCGADPELVALCRRSLAANREERFADGTQLAQAVEQHRIEVEERFLQAEKDKAASEAKAIEEANTQKETSAKEEAIQKRRNAQWSFRIALTLLIAAGAVGVYLAADRQSKDENRSEAERKSDSFIDEKKRLVALEYGSRMQLAYDQWQIGNHSKFQSLIEDNDQNPKEYIVTGRIIWEKIWENDYLKKLVDPSLATLGDKLTWSWQSSGKNKIVGYSDSDSSFKIWNSAFRSKNLDINKHVGYKFDGHTAGINSAEFNFDGDKIVTASKDNTVRVWDIKSNKPLLKLDIKGDGNTQARWICNGNQLLVSVANRLKTYDSKNGKELNVPDWFGSWLVYQPWNFDGSKFVVFDRVPLVGDVGPPDNFARIYDMETGNLVKTLNGHSGPVTRAFWSRDGKKLLTMAIDDPYYILWDVESGHEIIKIFSGITDADDIVHVDVDWDFDNNKIVFTHGNNYSAYIVNLKDGKLIAKLQGHKKPVFAAYWSKDGKRILTSGFDDSARIFNAVTGDEINAFKIERLGYAGWCDGDNKIVTLYQGGKARLWDADKKIEYSVIDSGGYQLSQAVFNPEGSRIASGSNDGSVIIWDSNKTAIDKILKGHTGQVSAVKWSNDGKLLVSGGIDQKVIVWDYESGQQKIIMRDLRSPVASIAIDKENSSILIGFQEYNKNKKCDVEIYDLRTGKIRTILGGVGGHTQSVNAIDFSPDGLKIMTGSWDGTSIIWKTSSGEKCFTIPTGSVTSASWSKNGMRILTVGCDHAARVWDARIGSLLLELKGDTTTRMISCRFGPENRILTGNNIGEVQIWDSKLGIKLLTLQNLNFPTNSVEFDPSGNLILVSTSMATYIFDKRSMKDLDNLSKIQK